jgi:hypothetical protein
MTKKVIGALALLLLAACTPTEWTNRLPYAGPMEIGIAQGEFLPGTDIQYLGKNEKGAQVSIGDKQATKKIGDSLDWMGEMIRGATVDQTLRVALITDELLHSVGTVRIIVANPRPQAETPDTSAPVHYKLPVGYHVDKGRTIPGTPITYLGNTDQGAELGNVEGYAFRKIGDSIVWEGKLREGFWIGLDLRTVLVTDSMLDIVGTVDIWITPP